MKKVLQIKRFKLTKQGTYLSIRVYIEGMFFFYKIKEHRSSKTWLSTKEVGPFSTVLDCILHALKRRL